MRLSSLLSTIAAIIIASEAVGETDRKEEVAVMAELTCAKNSQRYDENEPPPWDVEEVEKVWGEPLDPDLLLVGGVDGYGWMRVCRIPGERADLFEGEYRDRTTWYRGRFQLRDPEGDAVPADVLERFYVSGYGGSDGLVLYPVEDIVPRPSLRLVPIDPEGFAVLSAQD